MKSGVIISNVAGAPEGAGGGTTVSNQVAETPEDAEAIIMVL